MDTHLLLHRSGAEQWPLKWCYGPPLQNKGLYTVNTAAQRGVRAHCKSRLALRKAGHHSNEAQPLYKALPIQHLATLIFTSIRGHGIVLVVF